MSILEYCAKSPDRSNLNLILCLGANPNINARDGRNIMESLLHSIKEGYQSYPRETNFLKDQIITIIKYPYTNLNIEPSESQSFLNAVLTFAFSAENYIGKESYLNIAEEIVSFGAEINDENLHSIRIFKRERIERIERERMREDSSDDEEVNINYRKLEDRLLKEIDFLIAISKEMKSIKNEVQNGRLALLKKIKSYKELNNVDLAKAIKNKDFDPNESTKQIIKFKAIDKSIGKLFVDLSKQNSNLSILKIAEKHVEILRVKIKDLDSTKSKDEIKGEIKKIKNQIKFIEAHFINSIAQNIFYKKDIEPYVEKLIEDGYNLLNMNTSNIVMNDIDNVSKSDINRPE